MLKTQKFIKESRKQLKLTQKELALKLGIKRYNIAKYETGKTIPPGDIVLTVLEFLNVTNN